MIYFASLGFFLYIRNAGHRSNKITMLVIKIVKTVHNMYVMCRLENIF